MNINVEKTVKAYCVTVTIMLIIAAILFAVLITAEKPAAATEPEHEINTYYALEENFTLDMEDYRIYDPDELTTEILTNRMDGDEVIIERVIGKVTNKTTGDGKIINTDEEIYNYISYRNVDFKIADGTIILTYLIYNPESNGEDDIIDRFDFVLDREFED